MEEPTGETGGEFIQRDREAAQAVNDGFVETSNMVEQDDRLITKDFIFICPPAHHPPAALDNNKQILMSLQRGFFSFLFFFLNIIFYVERNKEQHLAKMCVF